MLLQCEGVFYYHAREAKEAVKHPVSMKEATVNEAGISIASAWRGGRNMVLHYLPD